jgi:hypothetical protein
LATPAEGRLPDGSDEQRAHEISRQARNALRDGRKDIAAERLREAWEVFKNPWYMCDLGGVYMDMGRVSEAAQSLSACLRLMKPKDQKFVRPKVERALKDARSKVGVLTVDANVPDAEVFVDGKATGKLPLEDPIFLDPGSHEVEVKAPGYLSDIRMAVLTAGTSLRIRMRLDPMRVEVAPPAQERAPREPEKDVQPTKPATMPPVPPVVVNAPVPMRLPERAAEPARAPVRGAVIITGFGLGVAGAVIGTAGFMAAGTAGEEAKAMYRDLAGSAAQCAPGAPGPCKGAEEKIDTSRALTALGVGGFAVSALGGALLVYEFVQSDRQGGKPAARITVEPTRGGGLLTVTGGF